jgi:SRSO17 transposase
MTTSAEIADWRGGLDALHGRIAHRFRRAEARGRVKRYLAGLLERVERKNGWQLAEHLGEAGPQGVQRLLNAADWDVAAVRDDLRSYVTEHLGEPAGVLIVDETGFLKKGTKSVGVQRQYSGTAGRIENCQIGVFLGYASATGRAFLDRELYLPQEWAQDPVRRGEAGVPPEVTFATKPALAQQMLARAFAAGVPAAWVSGDEIYGDDGALRRWLEAGNHPYVLAVAAHHPVWPAGRQERADHLIAALSAEAWAPLSAGTGSQGERLDDWACIQLSYESTPGTAHWLLARRSLSDPAERAYYRVFAPVDTPVATMVRVAGMRWAIEASFEDAKGAVGLDHYEVRKWTAWYRHVTLALLAHAYLEVTRLQATAGQKGGRRTSSPSPCQKSAACC